MSIWFPLSNILIYGDCLCVRVTRYTYRLRNGLIIIYKLLINIADSRLCMNAYNHGKGDYIFKLHKMYKIFFIC